MIWGSDEEWYVNYNFTCAVEKSRAKRCLNVGVIL